MQSSGVGNCINMLSLARECAFPLIMLITMRGLWQEFNPWQNHMGQQSAPVLESMGVSVAWAEAPTKVAPAVKEAIQAAYDRNSVQAVLLHQKLMPAKTFGKAPARS